MLKARKFTTAAELELGDILCFLGAPYRVINIMPSTSREKMYVALISVIDDYTKRFQTYNSDFQLTIYTAEERLAPINIVAEDQC